MNEKAEFAARLKAAIEAKGLEPRPMVVEKNFNERYWGQSVSFQAVRRWLRGDSIPEQDKLVVLAEWLEVEPQVLRYGAPAKGVKEGRPAWPSGLKAEERELVELLLALPAAQRKVIREVILAFCKAGKS